MLKKLRKNRRASSVESEKDDDILVQQAPAIEKDLSHSVLVALIESNHLYTQCKMFPCPLLLLKADITDFIFASVVTRSAVCLTAYGTGN